MPGAQATNATSSRLVAELRAESKYSAGTAVVVHFRLCNVSDQALAVLARDTPLEGLASACLTVRRGRRAVRYEGVLIKRGPPEPAEYLHLAPGEHATVAFDLADAYDLPAGAYRVRFDTPIGDVVETAANVPLALQILGRREQRPERVRAAVSFRVTGRSRPARTRAVRLSEATAWLDSPAFVAPKPTSKQAEHLREPAFNGGDAARRAIVREAHSQASVLCGTAISHLAVGPDETSAEWFGSTGNLSRVLQNLQAVADELKGRTVYYDLTEFGCQGGWWAYTMPHTPQTPKIHLCSKFWDASTTGLDSRGGTILHELTHAVCGTGDYAYDVGQARKLAKSDPGRAADCANNYQYFAERG